MNFTLEEFSRHADMYEGMAKESGLTFFPIRYEICPADVIYTIAGFGMPTRFSHWSFGKHYHQEKMMYEMGMSKIYELVVNSDPCYAFFMDQNTMIQNKLIIAHILGHADFFKNNHCFAGTQRDMIDKMSASARRFKEYEREYGVNTVESFIDAILSFQEHVDPYYKPEPTEKEVVKNTVGRYDDLLGPRKVENSDYVRPRQKDLLMYILENNSQLKFWQQDILSTLREEMLYFWPQIQTKIMNEGWASYWHTELLRQSDLTASETIDFAKLTSGVMQPNKKDINPYNVGYHMWRYIEKEYGRQAMFEIRETDSDVSFLRNYLSQEVVDECDLYLYESDPNSDTGELIAVEKDYKVIRDMIVSSKTNGGIPVITVEPKTHRIDSTLDLVHEYEGKEIKLSYVRKVLPKIKQVWGAPVRITTFTEGRKVILSCGEDGKVVTNVV